MSIIINNNASILDKEQHLNIYDRERRISVVEQMENIEGIGESLSKVISYEADESENDEESNYTTFVPIVSTDNYDSVNTPLTNASDLHLKALKNANANSTSSLHNLNKSKTPTPNQTPKSSIANIPSMMNLYQSHSNQGSGVSLAHSNTGVYTNGVGMVQKGTVAHHEDPYIYYPNDSKDEDVFEINWSPQVSSDNQTPGFNTKM
ncbi:hypothetical protein BOH78_4695 [Pichia kudriavzevii]|uniref:Uncharacterized protein n=1 Tax=Pichia kudriavzevii TaxID=4909 RepID=A0A1V2LIS3_PICKU|nr:hypothetical protein BOH78_5323 [Pichia kudriavzevii]ONH70312.1 hypothetical protein BOH78_5320 [Pichia kudriavzevii]ONH70806.1 hypothetical protein BOH78_4953 [Pichia kudriavzevii]ONH71226.1 hypothetical protein BOH78_4695 [Pichia kudriavzevii]